MAELILKECVACVFFSFRNVTLACADADGVPVDVERRLPTFTALAPVHANFAV
ncbi:hypothetical protein LOKVESSMR4R_00835 [Yoonia vestfoldensis]|uniref:Uncharacterized protein n=1 Tax=Yoonia vestfoldensis TaxID=245188 RepID=A0A1Y0E9I5_9RHOB|nr:hypothetical protein LOKVESSMR4R_00835 [Yoonia vestfoldensis]